MRFTVLFRCGLFEHCPHCEQDWPETACPGELRVKVETPTATPTNGYLMAAAGGRLYCPICGNRMVMTDRYESPEETGKATK